MMATEKMRALGMKALHERASVLRPKLALETVYRWLNALERGDGIPDRNKRLLIDATQDLGQPIAWSDFLPSEPLQ